MLFPKYFGKASQGKSGASAGNSGGSSWRKFKSPFNTNNANSIKLTSEAPSEFAQSYEFAERKNAGTSSTWIRGPNGDPEAAIKPGTGIHVLEIAGADKRKSTTREVANDSSSETWIMDEEKGLH